MADAKPAVERLSEDESLRGDLSDIGFSPLLDWAVAAVQAYAPQAANSDALDAYTGRVRGVVQSAVQAAQDSKLDDPAALLDFDPAGKDKILAALKDLKFGDDPDDNAVQIAAVLQSGLASAPSAAPSTEAPAPEAATQAPNGNAAPSSEAFQAVPEQVAAQPSAAPSPAEPAIEQKAAQPLKKNEQDGESASPALPADPSQNLNQSPNQNQNPEPPANPAPSNPRPGTFLASLRSGVGTAYQSAWGIFKGLSKRRSG